MMDIVVDATQRIFSNLKYKPLMAAVKKKILNHNAINFLDATGRAYHLKKWVVIKATSGLKVHTENIILVIVVLGKL